ncbi:MAG: winged helix DNA-binding domain-containing protein, partial [Actinomycetota bacterium]|nr:winged helix DNA-binding domain-containing protein [Actinomycetota bacterium]
MTTDVQRLTLRGLNRALLARQGLLDRLEAPLVEAVEAVGALQAQHWPALPVALWTRVRGFAVDDLYGALERDELVVGTILRATLHLVSAREHPAYAAVVAAAGTDDWRRTGAQTGDDVSALRAELLAYVRDVPRTGAEIADFIDEWVAAHPGAIEAAEVEHQRAYKWRAFLRWSGFVRAPADGRWGTKAPAA